jgi:Peptidase family M48
MSDNRAVLRLLLVPVLPLLGGVVAWLGGWYLIPERRSAIFPERWWGHVAGLMGLGGLLAGAMVLGVSPDAWSLGLALTATGLLVGHYPLRRAAYEEDWGVVRYVVTTARRAGAFFGFWMLVAITPQLIVNNPHHRWLAASTLAALMLAWARYRHEIVLYLVNATPLGRPPEAFSRVLAQTNMAAPVRVYRAGVPGGLWATSFSLPGPGGHVVVFGDSLIKALDADALTAIFAHEIAGLEQWTRRRMACVEAAQMGLVVAAVGAGIGLLQILSAESARLAAAAWGFAVLLALTLWTIARRGDEKATDLRAVTLRGDASALIRALCLVHAVRRIPRRLSALHEEMSAEPSLARRLQAIREAANIAPATLSAPVVLSSPDLERVVILGGGRAQWLDGVSARAPRDPVAVLSSADSIRSLTYRELTDLRLETGLRGAVWLVATHRSGRSWRVAIRPEDVDAAQAALDVIDERLAPHETFTRRRAALLVLWAAAAAGIAWAQVGVSPVIILAAIVIARPRRSPTWMLALLMLVWGLQDAAAPKIAAPPLVRTLSVAIMAIGGLAFAFGPAARRRAELRPSGREAAVVAAALIAPAGLLILDIFWVARSAAASIPYWRLDAVALSLLAGAAVLSLAPGRSWSHWIVAATSGALAVATLRWGGAVLAAWAPLASGTPVTLLDVPAPTAQVVALDPSARRLALSPSAKQFAVQVGRSRSGLPYRFVLGRFTGEQQVTSAYDVTFLDDSMALLLGPTASGLELRLVAVDLSDVLPPPVWSIALPPVYLPRVSVDAVGGIWTIVGWQPEDADAISVTGRLGEDMPEVKRWSIPGADTNASFFYLPQTKTAFLVTPTTLAYGAALLSRLSGVPERRWELRKLDGAKGTTLAVTAATLACLDPLPRDTTLLCLAQHAAHTVVWSVDGRSGALSEVGALPSFRWALSSATHLRFVSGDGTVLQTARGGRRGTRFTPTEPGDIVEVSNAENHIAMLRRSGKDVRLSLYESR